MKLLPVLPSSGCSGVAVSCMPLRFASFCQLATKSGQLARNHQRASPGCNTKGMRLCTGATTAFGSVVTIEKQSPSRTAASSKGAPSSPAKLYWRFTARPVFWLRAFSVSCDSKKFVATTTHRSCSIASAHMPGFGPIAVSSRVLYTGRCDHSTVNPQVKRSTVIFPSRIVTTLTCEPGYACNPSPPAALPAVAAGQSASSFADGASPSSHATSATSPHEAATNLLHTANAPIR